jgi:hypothetical protein
MTNGVTPTSKLAHDLCDRYDVLVFETLNMDAMKRLWGRKSL